MQSIKVQYKLSILCVLVLMGACDRPQEARDKPIQLRQEYAVVIHGGAGSVTRDNISTEKAEKYRMALDSAITIGSEILSTGGKSIDAVEKVIRYMEDNPMFNSGRGAVFTNEGKNELDASIMVGSDQKAGAVGGVTNVKHPISAARKVMEETPHVLLVGRGAEEFAKKAGLEIVDPEYFYTEDNFKRLQEVKAKDMGSIEDINPDYKYGTVGCVALDKEGNIVAGTSTGGMTNKKYNRIGDSPIIGAGTYANNKTCGISCTGHGEYFIRYAVAYDIAARMEYKGLSLSAAADEVVMKKLVEKGGAGGIIGLDSYGNVSMVYNTPGMFRAYQNPNEKLVKVFTDE